MASPDWLPPLVLFKDYAGAWEKYLPAIYAFFRADFVDSAPEFRGVRLGLKRDPMEQGKEATFWHITSKGSIEAERTPDFRRCERIRWPRPIIEHDADPTLKVWANSLRGEERIYLWLEEENYVIVLAERKGYLLLWTAFLTTYSHEKRKLQNEYEASLKG